MFEIQQLPLQICVWGKRGEGRGRTDEGEERVGMKERREEGEWEKSEKGKMRKGEGVDFAVDQPHLIACSPYLPTLSPSSPSSLSFSLREDLHVREDY